MSAGQGNGVIGESLPFRIVCYHDNGPSVLIHLIAENSTDISCRLSIQRCRWLVGQNNFRIPDQRACNGHALLLSRAELIRFLIQLVLQTELGKNIAGSLHGVGGLNFPKLKSEDYVVDRRKRVKQSERLEDEADLFASDGRPGGFRKIVNGSAIDEYAALVRGQQTSQ